MSGGSLIAMAADQFVSGPPRSRAGPALSAPPASGPLGTFEAEWSSWPRQEFGRRSATTTRTRKGDLGLLVTASFSPTATVAT
jgi:hypothetical protein